MKHVPRICLILGASLANWLAAAPAVAQSNNSQKSNGFLLVANKGDDTLSVVDVNLGIQVAVIPEGATTGHEVAVSQDGRRAFVPIYGSAGVGQAGTDGRLDTRDRPSEVRGRRHGRPGQGDAPAPPRVRAEERPLVRHHGARELRHDHRPEVPEDRGLRSHRQPAVAHAGDHERRPPRLHGERQSRLRVGARPGVEKARHDDSRRDHHPAHRAVGRRPLGVHGGPDRAAPCRDRHGDEFRQHVDPACRASASGPPRLRTAAG